MKKGFTLTEIVISIVILGLLAGIILVNVFDTKDKAIATHIEGNIAVLQKATDAYYVEKDQYPTRQEPTYGRPERLLLEELSSEYIHDEAFDASVKHQTYWVDVDGRVWGSTAGSPEVVFETQEGVRWTPSDRAVSYDVYQDMGSQADVRHRLKKVTRLKGLPETNQYLYRKKGVLLSAVDRFGKATAPTMVGMDGFVPRMNFEGTFDYVVEGDEMFILDAFKTYEVKPVGTSIAYRFTTYDVKGNVLRDKVEAFPKGEKATKVKVTVEMKGSGGKKPSLKGIILHYHYEKQEEVLLHLVPKDQLPKNILEECVENCTAYRVPSRAIEKQTSKVYDTAVRGGSFIPTVNSESKPYTFLEDFVLVYGQSGEGVSETLSLIKDGELTIGEPSEAVDDVEKGTDMVNPHTASSVVSEKGWTTVESQFVVTGNPKGDAIHWIEAIIKDEVKDKENTKIVYRYSYFKGEGFMGSFDDFSKLPDSSSIRLTANRMVRTKMVGKTVEPEFKSATFRSEKGAVTLDGVRPTAFISYEKDNNVGRDVISTTSKVTWIYESFDPRGKEIVDVRWSGDVTTTYPTSGKKTITVEVKNSSGYWSNPTSYTFEVKNENPVAKLNPDYAILRTGEDIDWSKADLSSDPDGDGIVDREWQNVSSRYTEDGGSFVARLRVKDAEDNWSQWTEMPYSICKDVCFKGAASKKAWDSSFSTWEDLSGSSVIWDGNLEGRTLTFDVKDFSSVAGFSVKDKNGNDLITYIPTLNTSMKNIAMKGSPKLINGRSIIKIVMPENAKSIKFLSSYTRIYEVSVSSSDIVSSPNNLKAVPSSQSIRLSWDSALGAQKYLILKDGVYMGESSTTSFIAGELFSKTVYEYEVRSVGINETFSKGVFIQTSTLDDGLNLRGAPTAKAWDGLSSTWENLIGASMTWDGNIQGKTMSFQLYDFSSVSGFNVKDKNGNNLMTYIPIKKTYTEDVVIAGNARLTGGRMVLNIVMPENAKFIQFKNSKLSIYEITIIN